MWHASYFRSSFEDALVQSRDPRRKIYALTLYNCIDEKLSGWLRKNYANLHRDTGNAIQIIAPIRPPSLLEGPIDPITEYEGEDSDFSKELDRIGVNRCKLPGLLFFLIGDEGKPCGAKLVSLKYIEEGKCAEEEYNQFFRLVINAAHTASMNDVEMDFVKVFGRKLVFHRINRGAHKLFEKFQIKLGNS